MTACAIESSADPGSDGAPQAGCSITAGGAYAARLALGEASGDAWYPERWTLDGPEPYAVPLPGNQPEEPGTEVQPMGDGRVLVHRVAAGRHHFSLLYPTGPGTGEQSLGAIECPADTLGLRLLPPVPGGERAYALVAGPRATVLWQVAGGARGPERVGEIAGRCSGGVWLDRAGLMLALDRETGGRVKAVVVDLEREGEVSPLLQISADSDDRILLADPDSGLVLVRSDAPSPGRERIGWGVLGSTLPVRFPECLVLPDYVVTPFAIQPGQALTPERCAVALRVDGAFGSWVAVWRPAEREVRHLRAPAGWLKGAGLWTADGELRLPCSTPQLPCGLARLIAPGADDEYTQTAKNGKNGKNGERAETAGDAEESAPGESGEPGEPDTSAPAPQRPVPLQQAPLARLVTNSCRLAWPPGSGPRSAG